MSRRLRRPAAAAAGLIACALLIAGCATPPMTATLLRAPAAGGAQAQLLDRVPFFSQAAYQCGPAALAMVLAADGSTVVPEDLVGQVFVPARNGSLQPEMLATARRHGRLAVVLPPRLDAVIAEVAAGRPVVVLQNLALPLFPRWHYAVVVGYDLQRQHVLLHSGTTERLALPLAVFERTWARSGHWAMVAAPPAALPVTPDTGQLLGAAAALERVDRLAAAEAFEALTRRAPASHGAWFGLGNTRYAGGDLAGAHAAFERATSLDAGAADAWNNLAIVQLALGRLAEARTSAERAVALGGPRTDRYRDTLAAVERARRS